jgi:N-acetylmuramoyl-L-alanine amidase
MIIKPDHTLDTAKLALLPGGSMMPVRRLLVIHFTSGMSAQSSIDFWKSPEAKGASAHLIIDRDGTIFQCRAFNRTAGHAGVSEWFDKANDIKRAGCNAFSIGIELANAGDSVTGSVENPLAFKKYPCPAGAMYARHKNGGPVTLWENYPKPQLTACFNVARALFDHYHLDDVRGHDDIAPQRKNDPGPAFPMVQLREALNLPLT